MNLDFLDLMKYEDLTPELRYHRKYRNIVRKTETKNLDLTPYRKENESYRKYKQRRNFNAAVIKWNKHGKLVYNAKEIINKGLITQRPKGPFTGKLNIKKSDKINSRRAKRDLQRNQ